MPATTELHLIVHSDKSVAYVTNNTSSSAVAERPRVALCPLVVSFNSVPRTQSFIIVRFTTVLLCTIKCSAECIALAAPTVTPPSAVNAWRLQAFTALGGVT